MDMPILEGYEEDTPMTSESDNESTQPDIVNPNKRRHHDTTTDGFVFPKKTTKVSTLTPTPNGPLPTSNRFQVLPPATDPTPKQPPAEPKPAPIHAYTPDYRKLILDLSQSIKNPTHYKYLTDHLLIKTSTLLDYQKVIKHLDSSKIHYFTYSIKASRPVKYVIKHLPNDLSNEEIKSNLTSQGAVVNEVSNLRMRDGTKSTCFLVSSPSESVALLQKITNVLQMRISFEPYRRRTALAQCYRCQRFGHSSDCCRLPFRCLRCGGEHRSADCGSPRNDQFVPKCANCGGQHSANYRGCPLYKTKLEALKNAKPNTTPRAPASSIAPKPTTPTPTPKPRATPPATTKENFPALPSKPTPPLTQRRPWGPPKDQTPKETTAQPDSLLGSLKEITDLFKSFDFPKILTTIKETVQKIKQASSPMEKLLILIESVSSFFNE